MTNSPNDITRRSFINKASRGLLATTAAEALLKTASAQLRVPDPPGKKLGWAIVGLGSLSINQILPAFAKCEKSKVVALVSGHPDKASKLALRYGVSPKNIYNYQNYDSIKDNPDVDIIYIVLPNGMHAEYTVRGHQAGKHVLSEKPMANTPAECQQMIDAARKANRKLMIAYRCRYEPYNREAIRIAQSGEIGPTQMILADAGFKMGDPTVWRLNRQLAGGGSLMDIGIYALNATRYLTGEEPTEVNAMIYSTPDDPRFKEVEEHVNFQLRFPSGILANCSSSYGYFHQSHFRVMGTEARLCMDPATWYSGLRMWIERGNTIEQKDLPEVDHFAAEMDHMSDCVMQNKQPLTPGEEGLRDLTLMAGIYEAARSGKTVKL
ncbi:MAG: glucose-fructose oxidoreductase [Acidobacteria bacterium]|nr:MAG: glucose-fructose oxidoreductase [Acidobacteriota bacterium]PYV77912.1 MAG: glucose-fructose oxidoreductase [Acidobacteriota bacterium]PYV79712.1 MAG: glucose-fructose oxidoreductase [Acidobacteriota bacterium]